MVEETRRRRKRREEEETMATDKKEKAEDLVPETRADRSDAVARVNFENQ